MELIFSFLLTLVKCVGLIGFGFLCLFLIEIGMAIYFGPLSIDEGQ